MDLEKMTALELAEKIKQRQISVLDGVKTVFAAIEKRKTGYTLILTFIKKRLMREPDRWKKALRREFTQGLWQEFL